MNPYEITFIVRPDLDDEATRGAVDGVRRRIEAAGGEILAAYPWGPGRRRLAYPIRDFGDGYYFTIDFNFDPQAVRDLENALRLNDTLLRYLVVSATDQYIKNAQQRMQQQAQQAAQAAAQAAAPAPAGAVPGRPAAAPGAPAPTAPVEGAAAQPVPAGPAAADTSGPSSPTEPPLANQEESLPTVIIAEPALPEATATPPQEETVPAGATPVARPEEE